MANQNDPTAAVVPADDDDTLRLPSISKQKTKTKNEGEAGGQLERMVTLPPLAQNSPILRIDSDHTCGNTGAVWSHSTAPIRSLTR